MLIVIRARYVFGNSGDRAIRSLIEYQYLHRKLNNFGLFGMICGLFAFNHPIFGVVEMWYGLKEKIGFDMMIGKKKYYRLYDSYKIFEIPQQTAKKAG